MHKILKFDSSAAKTHCNSSDKSRIALNELSFGLAIARLCFPDQQYVSPEAFVNAVKENGADIIACSALLTTTMAEMKNVVDLCKAEGIRDGVKIMIGGAPITDAYKTEIGADIYTSDAASAAEAAAALFA